MIVARLECTSCGDRWHVPNPDVVRDICRACGSKLDVEFETVEINDA